MVAHAYLHTQHTALPPTLLLLLALHLLRVPPSSSSESAQLPITHAAATLLQGPGVLALASGHHSDGAWPQGSTGAVRPLACRLVLLLHLQE